MSTVETTNLKNPSSGSNNIVLNTDGTVGGELGTALGLKAPLESPTFTGTVTVPGINLGAPVSYTPVWSGAITPGNGTSTGSYIKIGRLVFFEARFTFGSTSSMGSGAANHTLPFPATGDIGVNHVGLLDSGNTGMFGFSGNVPEALGISNTTRITGNGTFAGFTSSTPFTWTTNDKIQSSGFYVATS